MLHTVVRLVFAVLGGLAGYQLATVVRRSDLMTSLSHSYRLPISVLVVIAGALAGWLVGSLLARLLRKLVASLDDVLEAHSGAEILVGSLGLVVGLGVAALFSLALNRVPYIGDYLLVPLFIVCGYLAAYLAARKHLEILHLVGVRPSVGEGGTPKVIDSSAIIDGRMAEIVKSGFLEGELLVPRFVVEELQRLADSADAEKRARGRRGLDYVRKLQHESQHVRIVDVDYTDLAEVDAKLLRLGAELDADVVTTDYTLNKVAEIQGVRVLNVNELANAVKSAVLPGEEITVKVLREGREQAQGVGYLDDGTMIVVEEGAMMVGSRVRAEVTSVLQSPSGKMVFARLLK
ncbi:MAG: PIN/TRAM domain-containing protein [Thermoleophilia bacterium]